MSAQQFRLLIQVFSEGVHRQEFFCIFHTRVVDPSRLLSPDILHSNIFSVADRREVVRRVGHLQLLNPMHPEGAEYECNRSTRSVWSWSSWCSWHSRSPAAT